MELSVLYGAVWHWLFPLECSFMLSFLCMCERDVKSVVVRCKFYSNSAASIYNHIYRMNFILGDPNVLCRLFYQEMQNAATFHGWWDWLVTSSRVTLGLQMESESVLGPGSFGRWVWCQENAFPYRGVRKSLVVMALRVGLHSKVRTPTNHSRKNRELIILWMARAVYFV